MLFDTFYIEMIGATTTTRTTTRTTTTVECVDCCRSFNGCWNTDSRLFCCLQRQKRSPLSTLLLLLVSLGGGARARNGSVQNPKIISGLGKRGVGTILLSFLIKLSFYEFEQLFVSFAIDKLLSVLHTF